MLDSFSFLTTRENKTASARRKNKLLSHLNESEILQERPTTTLFNRTQGSYTYRSIGEAEE